MATYSFQGSPTYSYTYNSIDVLLNALYDNSAGQISASDIRNSFYTLYNQITSITISNTQSYYTNSTPTPINIGGISIGTTFSNTIQNVLNQLLYPYVQPYLTLSVNNPILEYGNTVSNLIFNYITSKRSNTIQSGLLYRQYGTPYYSTLNSFSGTLSVTQSSNLSLGSLYTPNVFNTFTASIYDNTTHTIATTSISFQSKRYYGIVNLNSLFLSSQDINECSPSELTNIQSFITSDVIKGNGYSTMSSEFTNNIRQFSKQITGNGNYILLAWPNSIGLPLGWSSSGINIDGLNTNSFINILSNYNFVNYYNYSSNYDVWISNIPYISTKTIQIL